MCTQLLSGATDEIKEYYGLYSPENYLYLAKSRCYTVDGVDDKRDFEVCVCVPCGCVSTVSAKFLVVCKSTQSVDGRTGRFSDVTPSSVLREGLFPAGDALHLRHLHNWVFSGGRELPFCAHSQLLSFFSAMTLCTCATCVTVSCGGRRLPVFSHSHHFLTSPPPCPAPSHLQEVLGAMNTIGLSDDDQNNLVRILAAVLHLVRPGYPVA